MESRRTRLSKPVIRIGPAGWKCKDWEGMVYPQPAPRGFDPLTYIAEYFTTAQPCRTTLGIIALPTPIAIELKCIAAIPEGR